LYAQKIYVSANAEKEEIKIGEQITLQLKVEYEVTEGNHVVINWPLIVDSIISKIEVVGQSKVDTVIADSLTPIKITLSKSIYITSFDSGKYVLPPLKFSQLSDSTPLFTQAVPLIVNSVAVDTTLAIKDIKPLYEENYSFLDWIKDNAMWIAIGWAVVAIIVIVLYYMRKRMNKIPEVIEEVKPVLPAHVIAFEKLDKLKEEKLWQNNMYKQYYISLSEIIREYIENRFKLQALEQTSDEILIGFRSVAIDAESMERLKQILLLSDLVKFAKEQPIANENEMSLNNAYDFINGTKKEEETQQQINV
jgi:hypothetical protein